MISLSEYFMGRDAQYPEECTQEVKNNAEKLLDRVNKLLAVVMEAGILLEVNPATSSFVTSGWRPSAINAATPNAAYRSRHMTGQAVDIFDPHGILDEWIWSHQNELTKFDLFMEHPAQTKGWCHLQTTPPKSQEIYTASNMRRWFYA